jgi:hypothetical protein
MYEISFFREKTIRLHFSVTPNKTGSVLPSPEEWRLWFSQPAYPELALEGGVLGGLRQASISTVIASILAMDR